MINKDLVQKILHWRHTGFNVHSKVRTETKQDAERVGKYMIRPILSLKRLSFKAARPLPPQAQLSMAAEELSGYM